MRNTGRLAIALTVALGVIAGRADAFYEYRADTSSADLRGTFRLVNVVMKNPPDRALYPHRADMAGGAVLRLLFDGRASEHLGVEFNAYNFFEHRSAANLAGEEVIDSSERSPALETHYSDTPRADSRLVVDRLNVRLSKGRLDAVLGRQPVNLATCFYFTPNDFFAPFAAQTFFRLYKPGVDAATVDVRLGPLTQLTFIGALGYEPDRSTSNGFSEAVSRNRSSFIVRAVTAWRGFEWAALGGPVGKKDVLGGSLQGEMFNQWLGVRAEGHYAWPDEDSAYTEFAIEMEHRFTNALTMRLALFHHGSGAASADGYAETIFSGEPILSPYLGRRYAAIGASYEVSPLMFSEFVGLVNVTDGSALLSFNAIHSLSDEAEFSWGIAAPVGEAPVGFDINSEYGLFPYSINFEFRYFF